MPVCAEELEVNGPKGEFWKAALGRGNLKEGMVADVKALLKEREATHVAAVPQAGSRTAGAAVREPRMGEIAGWVTAVAGAGLLIGYVVEALQARSTKSHRLGSPKANGKRGPPTSSSDWDLVPKR